MFVYGTLSFPEILSALLGREAVGERGVLSGYKRVRVKDKVYPGLIEASSVNKVEGRVHSDISKEELELLDTFEDSFYKRVSLPIVLASSDTVEAATYIIPKENLEFASDEVWDRDNFSEKYIPEYLVMVKRYRAEFMSGHRGSQDFS